MSELFKNYLDDLAQQKAQKRSFDTLFNTPEPDAMAEGLSLGQELGVQPAAVLGNTGMFRNLAAQKRAGAALANAPKLQDWLGDPVNGALAKDDLDNLSMFERWAKDFTTAYVDMGDTGEARGQEVAQGASGVVQSTLRARGIDEVALSQALQQQAPARVQEAARQVERYRFILERGRSDDGQSKMSDDERAVYEQRLSDAMVAVETWADVEEFGPTFGGAREQTAERAAAALKTWTDETFGVPPEDDSFWSDLAYGTGSMLAFIAPSLVPGGVVATAQMGADAAKVEAYDRAIAEGATEEDALAASQIAGFMGTSEAIPIGRALNRIPEPLRRDVLGRIGRFIVRSGKGSIEEATQEAFMAITQNMIAQGIYDPDAGIINEDVGRQALVGAVLGGLMGGGASLVQDAAETRRLKEFDLEMRRYVNNGQTAAALQGLDQMVAASKVRERAPSKFEEAVDVAGLSDQSLYVPADAVREYFQAKDIEITDDLIAAWGIDPVEFEANATAGADVAIPASIYAARLSGTEHAAWLHENATFDPDEMSIAEARAFNAKVEEIMQEAFDEQELDRQRDMETRSSEAQVYDQVFSQLRAAGRTPDVARQEAAVVTAFFSTNAQRWGDDALDLARRFGLRIQGPEQSDAFRRRGEIDRMINTLRAQGDKALAPRGYSLTDFIIARGGIRDEGGDVEAMDPPKGLVAETSAQIAERNSQPTLGGMPAEARGEGLDDLGRAAIEAGYFPELLGGSEQADGTVIDEANLLLDALADELAGQPRYVEGQGPDDGLVALADEISRAGLDIGAMSNDEIVAALEGARGQGDGQMFQSAPPTESAAFKEWFGDSKVVDESGQPRVVFHGSPAMFDAFDPEKAGGADQEGPGFYFTSDKEEADRYAVGEGRHGKDQVTGPTLEVYLRIENPVPLDGPIPEADVEKALLLAEDVRSLEELQQKFEEDEDAFWDSPLSNWTEDPVSSFEMLKASVMSADSPHEAFQTVWYDGFGGDNARYMAAMIEVGYDGVIIPNETKHAGNDHFIAFSPTQIKSVNNRGTFDKSDPRVLYQSAAEQGQPLYVVHNLSAENLRHAVDVGGLAAPSIAIARGDIGFDSFGEISLIGSPGMADPKGKGVRAFGADIYSPRQPRSRFKVNGKALARLQDDLGPIAERFGFRFTLDGSDIERDGLSSVVGSDVAKIAFLEDQGVDVPVQYVAPKPPAERLPGFNGGTMPYEVMQDPGFEAAAMAYVEGQIERVAELGGDKDLDVVRGYYLDADGNLSEEGRDKVARVAARRNAENDAYDPSPTGRVSTFDTAREVQKIIDGREEEFNEWVADRYGDAVGEAFFETAGGRRRAYTLQNLVREMTREVRNGEKFSYGAANVRAAVAPEFKTLDAIKGKRDRIIAEKDFENLKGEINERLFELADKFAPYHSSSDSFGWGDIFTDFLMDLAKGQRALEKWQTEWFSAPAPVELIAEAQAFLDALRDLPTGYFEVKMQRAVDLGEFEAALVPEKAPADVRAALQEAGLQVIDYTPDNEGRGREKALEQIGQRVFFQAQRDAGGRSVQAERNADAPVDAVRLSDLPERDNKDAVGALREGAGDYVLASGERVKVTVSATRKALSRNAGAVKRSLAGHFGEIAQSAVTYGERGDFTYAVAHLSLDGVDYAVRLVLRKAGDGEFRLHQVEGVDVPPIAANPDGQGNDPRVRGAAHNYKVSELVAVFNDMSQGEFPLFQGEGDKRGSVQFPRGGLVDGETVISLFEAADLSTFLHEFGHYSLEVFSELASDPAAPQQMQDDLKAIRDWLKLEDGAEITTEQHEKWARGFEAYTMEGKAPSLALADAFERFKSWMLNIYKSVRGLNVKLTPEIRDVMDRMLATDEQIAQARDEAAMRPMFRDEAPAGMSKSDFAAYQRLAARSVSEAEASLRERTLAKVRREREAWFRDEKKAVREEVEAEFNRRREYRLIEALGNGRWLGDEVGEVPDMRMDRDKLVAMFGEGVVAELSRSRLGGKRAIYTKGGESPAAVADFFGFANEIEMIETLQNTRKRKDAIDAETDWRMTERHGDPLNDGSIEEEALARVHNEQQAQVATAELRHVARMAGRSDRGMRAREFRQRAKILIGKMTVKEAAKPHRFLAAERKAAQAAERAFATVATGNGKKAEAALEEAYRAKEQQVLNHYLYVEARDFAKRLDAARERMRGYAKKSVRAKLDGGYIEQIDALLDRFDFRKRSEKDINRAESLRDFVARMEQEGREAELSIDTRLMDEARRTHYTRLSVNDLRGLLDTIANIDHMGRFKQKLIDRKRQRDLAESVSKVVGQIRKTQKDRPGGDERFGLKALNLLRKPDAIMGALDGGDDMGPVYSELKFAIDEGQAEEQRMQVEMAENFDALFSEHYTPKELRDMTDEKRIDGERQRLWTKQEIIAIALNVGNENNFQRLMDGNVHRDMVMSPERLHRLLSTLDERDWRFVQGMWDMVNGYWPDLAAVHKRRTGVEPEKVVGQMMYDGAPSFVTGGYYPIKYDPTKGKRAAQDEASAWDKYLTAGHGSTTAVRNGMTKQRQKTGGGRTLLFDLSVPFTHLRETVRYIALSEAVDNAYRILNHEETVAAFQETGSHDTLKTLNLWLKDTAQGPIFNTDLINTSARMVKNNFTMSRLAFNLKTVILQATGLGQSAATIGKRAMVKGMVAYAKRPQALIDDVVARSPMMAERQTTFQKDIYDFTNDLKMTSPMASRYMKGKGFIAKLGFYPIVKMQFLVVDMPTWVGAYQSGLDRFGGDEAKAAHYADRMVVRAQDSGLFADRAAIERGTVSENVRQADLIRLFTTLGGYMLTKLNRANIRAIQAQAEVSQAEGGTAKAAAAVSSATDMLLLFAFEAAMMGLIYALMTDEDEPEDLQAFLLQEVGMAVIGGVPVIRDMASAFRGYGGGGVYGSVTEIPANLLTQVAQGENDKALRRAVGDLVGTATGLPSTATMRLYEGLLGDDDTPMSEVFFGRNPLDR